MRGERSQTFLLAITIKALGYPSRSLLASWIRDAHPELRPRVGQAHETLSSQAKQSAVMALCLRQGSAQAVAQDLGVSRPSLYNWRNQLLSTEALKAMKPKPDPSPSSERDELERELEHLQQDVKRLKLEQMRPKTADEAIANEHYAEHAEKPFYGDLVDFLTRSPVFAMVVEGPDENTYLLVRKLVGATKVTDAEPGTIRGDFATVTTENLVHASDGHDSAEREIALWFPPA